MKVTLDLDKLREQKQITQAEYDKLLALSAHGTGSLAFNILVAFGVIAVSGGALALVPTPFTAVFLGAAVAIAGLVLGLRHRQRWGLLGNICTLTGAVMVGGAVIALGEASRESLIAVTVIFALAAIAGQSGLLATLAVLTLSSCLGAGTAYEHATYFLVIQQPFYTIVVFGVLAVALFQLSKFLQPDYSRLAIIASRTCVFLVNFGFWVGSLWGDRVIRHHGDSGTDTITAGSFTLLWIAALVITGVWAARSNRRWVVNVVATFGAILFYTQWFEHFAASPLTILVAGIIAIAVAMGIARYNQRAKVSA